MLPVLRCFCAAWLWTPFAALARGGDDTTLLHRFDQETELLLEINLPAFPPEDASPSVRMVVARYGENVSWLSQLDPDIEITLYNKGAPLADLDPGVKVRTLGNAPDGNEVHTYLYHILENYDDLANWTIFTQADPFPHSPAFLRLAGDVGRHTERAFSCLSCQYRPKGHPSCDAAGSPKLYQVFSKTLKHTDPELVYFDEVPFYMTLQAKNASEPAEQLVENLMLSVGMRRPGVKMDLCFAAEFAVHRSAILQHPRSAYERLMEELFFAVPKGDSPEKWNCADCVAKPMAGLIYERLWAHIFSSDAASKSEHRADK